MCYRLLEWARLYKTVRFLHVSSVTEAAAILTKYEDASIDHLVVGGHGATDSIEFNGHVSNGELKVGDRLSTWFWSVARAKLTSTASLFLDSCLNAAEPSQADDRGWKNHLMFVSHLMPGYRVHASSISLRAAQTVVHDFLNFHVLIRNVTSGAPGDAKSSKNHVVVGNCENTPDWTDSIGNTCEDYALKGLCLANLEQQKSKGIEYNGSKFSVCSLGQKVFYRDFGEEWKQGELTSVKGGEIKVKPDGWEQGFVWDEVAISKNESTRPWKDGDRAGYRDSEDSDWAYGTVTGLADGQPAKVLPDGWDKAYSWNFYKQLAEGYGCQ
jgi:hypothetical protein